MIRTARHALLFLLTGAALTAAPALPAEAEEPAGLVLDAPLERSEPSRYQDTFLLTRLNSAAMPPDGLLAVTLGGRMGSTVLILDDLLERIDQMDYFLRAEIDPWPWLALEAELPWRTYSGGRDWVPASGSGLGDGHWQVQLGSAWWPGSWLHAAVFGGGNLPLGSEADGLGEGVFSPELGAAFTLQLWRGASVPELRLHLNFKHRWNRNEENGYGQGVSGFQPWPPRYASAAVMGGEDRNDADILGAALEFRKAEASLWLEFVAERFVETDAIADEEMYRALSAGLRWGVTEKWALLADYQVCLSTDDLTTDWQPGFPEMVSTIAVARQFGFGGRDRDGDGIVDRHDHCPRQAEDIDRFQDDDGCPDFDNDRDGIPDDYDRAPNAPEDLDGFEDLDGIPDFDNDGDGIPDKDDFCPDEPEDFDGHRDDDGCPDDFLDRDGDGIEDSKDACPDDAEDLDGFEDEDGCPELDNDLDGLPDSEDECPDEAENYNGVDDDDGCPDSGAEGGQG